MPPAITVHRRLAASPLGPQANNALLAGAALRRPRPAGWVGRYPRVPKRRISPVPPHLRHRPQRDSELPPFRLVPLHAGQRRTGCRRTSIHQMPATMIAIISTYPAMPAYPRILPPYASQITPEAAQQQRIFSSRGNNFESNKTQNSHG